MAECRWLKPELVAAIEFLEVDQRRSPASLSIRRLTRRGNELVVAWTEGAETRGDPEQVKTAVAVVPEIRKADPCGPASCYP